MPRVPKKRSTRSRQILIKFFRDEDHLDQLIAGRVYANTPEFFRRLSTPGVSDRHESVTHTYRAARGDVPPRLRINGREIEGLTALTIRSGGGKDARLHSWTLIELPSSNRAFKRFVSDLRRMQREFGPHQAIIDEQITQFLERVRALTDERVNLVRVEYSDEPDRQSPVCKRSPYAYQREVRLLIGECSDHDVTARTYTDPQGFSDIITKNAHLEFKHDSGIRILEIKGTLPIRCYRDGKIPHPHARKPNPRRRGKAFLNRRR